MPRSAFSLHAACLLGLCWLAQACPLEPPKDPAAPKPLEFIRLGKERNRFVFSGSNARFIPWGFNYDHDASNRLLEDYWKAEWSRVVRDFKAMKELGANTVRIHLQVSSFMKSAREPNFESLAQLGRLLALAEETGLYLDVTGLGCYRKQDVPQWYNDLNEGPRWDVQARFWEAVARQCSQSAAVFCYDLMNEPIITGDKEDRDWTPGEFGGRCFVQRLTLDLNGRSQKRIARAWIDKLAAAIRKQDRQRLLTVGAIPWALTWPAAQPLFYSKEAGKKLDFVSVHFYPNQGEIPKALTALAVYSLGKPIVIEELFPLSCSVAELDQFIEGSRRLATGWIGFYWGKTIAEYKRQHSAIADPLTLEWLEYFVSKAPSISGLGQRGD